MKTRTLSFCRWLALFASGLGLWPSGASAQEWSWTKRQGGQGAERCTGIALNAAGEVYTAGWFESTATFDSQTLTVAGQRDAYLGKWAPNGDLAWVLRAGGPDEDYASAVTVDPNGNPIFMGAFRSARAEFGGLVLTNQYARDNNSVFLAKLTPAGKGIWVRQIGGASTGGDANSPASIQTDAGGNIYLVACLPRFANFGTTSLTGYEDIVIAKYDPDGNLAWARKAGGNGYDYGQGLAVTSGGYAYVTGVFEGTAPFSQASLTSRGLTDLFLAQYSPEGNLEWVTQAGGTGFDGNGTLAVDPEGGVLLAGFFAGSARVGTNVLTSKASLYDQDSFLARYDGLGNVRWVQQIGNATIDQDVPGGIAVSVTPVGSGLHTNIFLSGRYNTSTTVGTAAITNSGAQRLFVSQWEVDGQLLWVRQAGGDSSVIAASGGPNPSLYVAGQFTDPSAWNSSWLLTAGNSDAFLARLDPGAAPATPIKPAIVQAPRSVSTSVGSVAQLDVLIAGTPPVSYRWRKNGVALGDFNRVLGSATARLNLNSVLTNAAGDYTVVISNNYGAVTSAVAVVTVAPARPASGPAWGWVRTVGGNGSDSTTAMAVDGAGQVYAAGGFQKTNVIGNTTLVAPANAQNIFFAKYDPSGSPLWAVQAGGAKSDIATGLAEDHQGNVYLTGYFSSPTAAFGPTTLTNPAPSYNDLFLAKLDAAGEFQWAWSAGGTGDDLSRALTVDAAGNVLIVGDFSSPTLRFGGLVATNVGGTDVFVAKFNPRGEPLWVRTAGWSGSHDGNAIATDAAGNVYIAGEMWIRIRFGTIELDSHFDHDTFLAKYDPNGNLQWARQLNSFSVAVARNLAVDGQGDLIMSGYFDQSCNFDQQTLVAHGGQDVFLAKFNPAGEVVWAENFGGPGMDTPRSLAADAAGNVYLTGSFEQTADFGGVTLTTGGQRDLFVVAVDSTGHVIWAKQAGDTRSEDGFALAVGADAAVVVGGAFVSSVIFDGISYAPGNSGTDGFLARLAPPMLLPTIAIRIAPTGVQFELGGAIGRTVIIQGAMELQSPISWQSLAEVDLTAGPVVWNDALAGVTPRKFYRIVLKE